MVLLAVVGVLAPVFTPIDEEGQLNLAIIPKYANYLAENKVNGVLVGGTSGEAMCLNVQERKVLLEAWVKEAGTLGLKVVAQVGGAPLPDVIALAKHAEQVKADAMLTLPELYFKPSSAERLVDYLEMVSKAAPSIPLLYYHFPMMTGVDMNMPELYKLAAERILNFKGFKADLNVAVQLKDMLAADHRVFIANHLLAPSVLMGHDCSIATVSNLVPNLVRDIVDSSRSEDISRDTVQKQNKLNQFVNMITNHGKWDFVTTMKAAMFMMTGIKVGQPRLPLAPVTQEQMEHIQKFLIKFNNME